MALMERIKGARPEAPFEASRLVGALESLPVSEAMTPEASHGIRGDLIAAATSSLAQQLAGAQSEKIHSAILPARLMVDLAHALSVMPPWARERVEPSLVHSLTVWVATALEGRTTASDASSVLPEELHPKQVALLTSATARLHDDVLPQAVVNGLTAWILAHKDKTAKLGLDLQHVACLAARLSAAHCSDPVVYGVLSARAKDLLLRQGEEGATSGRSLDGVKAVLQKVLKI